MKLKLRHTKTAGTGLAETPHTTTKTNGQHDEKYAITTNADKKNHNKYCTTTKTAEKNDEKGTTASGLKTFEEVGWNRRNLAQNPTSGKKEQKRAERGARKAKWAARRTESGHKTKKTAKVLGVPERVRTCNNSRNVSRKPS